MIVYLLHYPNGNQLGHYLGFADSELAIDPHAVPHGRGWRRVGEGSDAPVVADVWESDTVKAQHALYDKLSRQGSRRRLCSVCNPGNARGAGRGNWERQPDGEPPSDPAEP